MDLITHDYVRAVHADRHVRLLADADHRRLRRPADGDRRSPDPAWTRRWRLRLSAAIGRRTDPKIDRIMHSWLGLGHRDAAVLAGAADEIQAPAGTVLTPGPHAYIALDDRHAGLVVVPTSPAVTLSSAARLLALPEGHLRALVAVIPRLRRVWEYSVCSPDGRDEPDVHVGPPERRRTEVVESAARPS